VIEIQQLLYTSREDKAIGFPSSVRLAAIAGVLIEEFGGQCPVQEFDNRFSVSTVTGLMAPFSMCWRARARSIWMSVKRGGQP
jgi:hypothetical protein